MRFVSRPTAISLVFFLGAIGISMVSFRISRSDDDSRAKTPARRRRRLQLSVEEIARRKNIAFNLSAVRRRRVQLSVALSARRVRNDALQEVHQTSGTRTAFVVPLHPAYFKLARRLIVSFEKYVNDSHRIDLCFIFLDRMDLNISKLQAKFTSCLPTLQEMADEDAGSRYSSKTFSGGDKLFNIKGGGGESTKFAPSKISDIKQLYAIRNMCEQRGDDGAGKYRYVSFFDAESSLLTRPPTGGKSFANLLDMIYGARRFFSGETTSGQICFDRIRDAAEWMLDRNISETLPPNRRHHDIADNFEKFGNPWWSQLPFIKCADAGEFFQDIRFPPLGKETFPRNHGFKYNQLILWSWLWSRRNFSPVKVIDGNKECRSGWCNLEHIDKYCERFPEQILVQMNSLWIPWFGYLKWKTNHRPRDQPNRTGDKNLIRRTSVFMVMHMDRSA